MAQQIIPVKLDIKFLVKTEKSNTRDSVQEFTILPSKLIGKYEHVIPVRWCSSLLEMKFG